MRGINIPKSVLAFLKSLMEYPDVDSLILFGSRAVGDHDERADIDLAISAPKMDSNTFSHMRTAAHPFHRRVE